MTFVIVSRTALVTMPIMLAVFALLHLKWRSIVIIACRAMVFAGLAWVASPQLRQTTGTFMRDYRLYKEQNTRPRSGCGWNSGRNRCGSLPRRRSFGHGTGSTRGPVRAGRRRSPGAASAEVIGNPHNQTLNVAVQWGALGVVVLYAMWLLHLLLFRGEGLVSWIGLLVVVQNIFTSLFNSHIFDFHEGWMYVLGVGVAGGMVLGRQPARSGCASAASSGRVMTAGMRARDGLSAASRRANPDIVGSWSAK